MCCQNKYCWKREVRPLPRQFIIAGKWKKENIWFYGGCVFGEKTGVPAAGGHLWNMRNVCSSHHSYVAALKAFHVLKAVSSLSQASLASHDIAGILKAGIYDQRYCVCENILLKWKTIFVISFCVERRIGIVSHSKTNLLFLIYLFRLTSARTV